MNYIMLVIKGLIIGFAKIMPGVSGAILAISMGVYDKGIYAITCFFKDVLENTKFLLFIGIGIFISIILGSNLVYYLLENYYVMTMLFFTGLIFGSTPKIIKKRNKNKIGTIITIITFILMSLITLSSINNEFTNKNNFLSIIIYFLSGIIDALGMVIPGISSTALLMIIGTYDDIMLSLAGLGNINTIISNIIVLLPYAIGIFLGIISVSLIINYLFKNHNQNTFSFIIGVILSTLFILIIKIFSYGLNVKKLIIGLILLILGSIISYIFDD